MIISVASGKGGTGKTLVATSLALALKDIEHVQLLDCDVEEPNDHLFLKSDYRLIESVGIPVPKINKEPCNICGMCALVCSYHARIVLPRDILILPNLCHGCGACAYLCPQKAITEEDRKIGVVESSKGGNIQLIQGKLDIGEAMAPPVIRKAKKRVGRDSLVIIDAPPGTSCPVIESIKGSDFCILVTEPTPFGLNDLQLAVEMVKYLKMPCGVIINRSGSGNDKDVMEYCQNQNIPVLLAIPFEIEIAGNYSRGITLVEGFPQWKPIFVDLFGKIQEILSERSRCN